MVHIIRIFPATKCNFCDSQILRNVCFAYSIFRNTKKFPVCLSCSEFIS